MSEAATKTNEPPSPIGDLSCLEHFPGVLTLCDENGTIIGMSREAAQSFDSSGGKELLGSDIFKCHPEPARSKLRKLITAGERNVYTIEKGGKRKLVYQTPWIVDGKIKGYMDLTFEIPLELPHFKRD